MYHRIPPTSVEHHLRKISSRSNRLYSILVLLIIVFIIFLPLFKFDVSVKSAGITRPINERTEIKSSVSGTIDKIFFNEGDFIQKDSLIIQLKDNTSPAKAIQNSYELNQRRTFVTDLEFLTSASILTQKNITDLASPLYKQQLNRFIYQQAEQQAILNKVKEELRMDSILSAGKVISPKEMFDKTLESEKNNAAYLAFRNEQIALWQQDLLKYRLELSKLESERRQITEEENLYKVKAPVAGIIQGLASKYAGNTIQAGETLCTISPETKLVAECYVSSQDIGLLRVNQNAKFQVDAFDYKYFGVTTGKIIGMDNDFTIMNNKPVFKVRCSFDSIRLHLQNGYTGQLRKGLTLQARFIITRRSLWQLMFDKVDDWLNPGAPFQTTF